MYVYVCTCKHTYTHIHIHIHIHTYTHARKHMRQCLRKNESHHTSALLSARVAVARELDKSACDARRTASSASFRNAAFFAAASSPAKKKGIGWGMGRDVVYECLFKYL